jgi:hypothetical protein
MSVEARPIPNLEKKGHVKGEVCSKKSLTGSTLLSRWEKRGRGGTEDETVKLLNGIQRV